MAYVEINKTAIVGVLLILIGMLLAVWVVSTWIEVLGVLLAVAGTYIICRRKRR